MPVFARPGFHHPVLGRLVQQAPPHHFHFEHQRLDIARDHQVAAAAQDKLGHVPPLGVSAERQCVCFIVNAHQSVGFCHDVEGVEGLQGDVVLD